MSLNDVRKQKEIDDMAKALFINAYTDVNETIWLTQYRFDDAVELAKAECERVARAYLKG